MTKIFEWSLLITYGTRHQVSINLSALDWAAASIFCAVIGSAFLCALFVGLFLGEKQGDSREQNVSSNGCALFIHAMDRKKLYGNY